MRVASSSPKPYLLNQAGGICAIREFSLVGRDLKVVPESDHPLLGIYELVYRCEDHDTYDIKRSVHSDGSKWSVMEDLPPDDTCDVCYPKPCN